LKKLSKEYFAYFFLFFIEKKSFFRIIPNEKIYK